MWLEKKFPFELRGKLSATPEQALKMFGYRMKPGAKGIIFRRRGKRTQMCSLIPTIYVAKDKEMRKRKKVFKLIVKMAKNHMHDIIQPVWNPIAKREKRHGFFLFLQTNLKAVGFPPKWECLKLTTGELQPPIIKSIRFIDKYLYIKIKNKADKKVGIGAISKSTLTLHHFPPKNQPKIYIGFKPLVLFVYFKEENKYSPSTQIKYG